MSETENLPYHPDSFLVAECGNATTNVLLFDVVEGAYRLIGRASAPTTVTAPWANLMEGLYEAINRLTLATGRQFVSGSKLITPEREGAGVDHFIFIVNAAAPLNTILVGLSEDVSLSSARRALHTVYANEIDTFSLTDPRSEEEQIAAIIAHKPDLVFLTGGTDGGADQRLTRFARTVSLGVNMLAGVKGVEVLYAGNINLREAIKQSLGENIPLHVAANVRPNMHTEQLDDVSRVMGDLYEDLKVKELPGIHIVRSWSQFAPLSTSRAFTSMVRYFAVLQKQKARVVGLDVSIESITLIAATDDEADMVIRCDLGMGRNLPNVLRHSSIANIVGWMPEAIDSGEVHDFIRNKSLQPQTIPMTTKEMYLEQAITRELIRVAASDTPFFTPTAFPFRMLLLRGLIFSHIPRPGQIILLVLDAIQPAGIFGVALDQFGVLPALGALSSLEPLAAVQTLESKVLLDLGWVVAPTGRGQAGQKVLHVSIETEDEGMRYEGDVEFGTLEVFALGQGRAKVTLKPGRRFDIGLGPGKGTTIHLPGSGVGLVVDARGRPLQLPQDEQARRSLIRQWHLDIGG